tara:strand:+ start:790 stop:2340 length:1551 start_codon:yes stop_codon:yes gene_type:complete
MTPKTLNPDVLEWSIEHLVKNGDTDIFPHPFELSFLRDMKSELVEVLTKIPCTDFLSVSALESLVPKSRYGFRVAHQLYPIDTLVLTAACVEIGEEIEKLRCPNEDKVAFSYRFSPSEDFDFFDLNCKYRHWLEYQFPIAVFSEEFTNVVITDISDFYQRISHHRLENCLEQASGNNGCVGLVRRYLKDIRARQSFGIPVGCNASRLLAELLLNDTDRALIAEGYKFTRYVDDYRFFLTAEQEPYALLAFLAEHLMINEGLSLNPTKTKVLTWAEFIQEINSKSGEDSGQAEQSASERLYYMFYEGEGEPGDEALTALLSKDLIAELEVELAKVFWDFGAIRILLRCLKLTKSTEAEQFIVQNLRQLLPFAKDVVLLMEELTLENSADFSMLADDVVSIIEEPVAQHLPVVRAWLLELFVREIIPCSAANLRRLTPLSSIWDRRALILLRGKQRDVSYFRARKARINEMSAWEQPAFVLAAKCLPSDEFETWLGNSKKLMTFPQSDLFCRWVLKLT